IKDAAKLEPVLREEIEAILLAAEGELALEPGLLNIFVMVGVNGAGKTTTIGKLAARYSGQGKKVLLAAADTFRAAASEQLAVWGRRAGVDVIMQGQGADPGAVAFDACHAALARKSDLLIIDTAGRLQNKSNLMEELKKILRVVRREAPEARVETLLVLDAGIGQNAISQAKLFGEAAALGGIILTKLDGTSKGGVIVGICRETGVPVKLIGVGEGIEDLRRFEPRQFALALFE
ncbi:MAG: signal recognition particle-docking protein FtsY, partial [Clostridiales bacterium]|nr:signal recognition particle-docking protein FtsY [Clostridiales bacterium]